MKLELRKFDISKLRDDSVVIFLGARNTGKSTALFCALKYHTTIPVGVVISGTESANHAFEKVIPKMLIYDEFDAAIIKKFMERQETIVNQANEEKKKYGRTDLDPRAFLILDDCLYDSKQWVNDKNIRYIFMNGRHYKVFLLITMQYPLGIPPSLRANVDYIFIMRNNMIKDREKIYQQYAGMFPNFDVFNQTMNACTENYECLVIDKKSQSNKLEDQVFWWKADTNINYKLCSPELWRIQEMEDERRAMGVDIEEDVEDDYDPQVIRKRPNAPQLTIKKKNG
jgi:hypothetical protein